MWHLLVAHQQESFLPFSSRQSLSCCLSHMAKGSTPKPPGPNSSQAVWSQPLPELCGPNLLHQSHMVLPGMAAAPGFKSQCQSSSTAPFLTPPTIGYTFQHSLFFQLYWAAIVCPGRRGPMAWSQSSPSSQPAAVTRGNCFPVTYWVEVTPISLAQSMATVI